MADSTSRLGGPIRGCALALATLSPIIEAPPVWAHAASIDASAMPGSNFGEKLSAAIQALPPQGGIVDARRLTGIQLVTRNPFSSPSRPLTILLGEIILILNQPLAVNNWTQLAILGTRPVTRIVPRYPVAIGGGSNRDIEISGLTIGPTDGHPAEFARGVAFSESSGISIHDNTISGAAALDPGNATAGILLDGVTDARIFRNDLFDNGNGSLPESNSDILVGGNLPSSRVKITQNTCRSVNVSANIETYFMSFSEISGNTVGNARTLASDKGHGGYGILIYRSKNAVDYEVTAPDTTVSDNIVRDNVVSHTEGTGIYVQSSRNTVIASNTVSDVAFGQNDADLLVGGISAAFGGDSAVSGNAITGNSVFRSGKSGISFSGLHVSVTGNTVRDALESGIWARGNAGQTGHAAVTGNSVVDAKIGIRAGAPEAGILLQGLAIQGNTISNTRAFVSWAGTQVVGYAGMVLGVDDSVVSTNSITYPKAFGVLMGGSRNAVIGNVVTGAGAGYPEGVGYPGMQLLGAKQNSIQANIVSSSLSEWSIVDDQDSGFNIVIGNNTGARAKEASISLVRELLPRTT